MLPLPLAQSNLAELAEVLRMDSANLFTPDGMDLSVYSDNVEFKDPITKYSDINGFIRNLRFLKSTFDPTYEMLAIRQVNETDLEARWTMGFDVVAIRRSPLGKFWQPRLEFTGTTVYGTNASTGLIERHIDTWDSISNQQYFSVEAFADVLRQIFSFQRTPQLRGPTLKLLKRKKAYSIRQYDRFVVAEAPMAAPGPVSSGNRAFGELARFLFGGNASSRSMAMTTPVITSDDGRMQFVLPLAHALEAPAPLPGSAVQVKEAPGGLYAALRFAGSMDDAVARCKADELIGLMESDGLRAGASFLLLRYNDPSVQPPFRRNEVLVPVSGGFDLWET